MGLIILATILYGLPFLLVIVGIDLLKKFILRPVAENRQSKIVLTSMSADEENTDIISNNDDISVTVKNPYFNPSNIKGFNGIVGNRKYIYRPQTLKDYIGQDKAKELIKLNIEKIKTLKPVHILISGWRGTGKSTLAQIIKNELNAKIIERIAGELENPEQVVELMNEINECKEENVILFLDETHSLKTKMCEIFYPIMEDFKIAGKKIRPFILIGATTEKNKLVDKVAPFVDRFQVQIELERYSTDDIITILKHYKDQLYGNLNIEEKNFDIIAKNCKFTPRIAISLLEDNLVEKDIAKVLCYHRIIENGLTDIDLKVLQILNDNPKPIGGKAISQMLGIGEKDYLSLYENYLISQEYIIRTSRGRIISNKGKNLLERKI